MPLVSLEHRNSGPFRLLNFLKPCVLMSNYYIYLQGLLALQTGNDVAHYSGVWLHTASVTIEILSWIVIFFLQKQLLPEETIIVEAPSTESQVFYFLLKRGAWKIITCMVQL